MPQQKMVIAPFKTGLSRDIEPWLLEPDSFSEIDNIHIYNGRLEKRNGYRLFANLEPMGTPIDIDDVSSSNPCIIKTSIAHGLSTSDKVYLSDIEGTIELNNKIYTITKLDATTFYINIDSRTLSAYTANGSATQCDEETDRVMGITQYVESDGTKTTLVFNARRAYRYNSGTGLFVQLDSADIFSSGEYDYVWSANWQSGGGDNYLYFTNGIAGTPSGSPTVNGIRYYNGTDTTVSYVPTLSVGPPSRTLVGASLIFSIGQRLLALDTQEYNGSEVRNYPQRARWCSKQNPDNWDDVIAGGGGYTDAATGDHIISARIIQNQVIVFFTNSVWALNPTSDPAAAFRWTRINNFRACGGKMATVAYDRYVVAFGSRGITATDRSETRRIDSRIQKLTIDDINAAEFKKVFCERSYDNSRQWALYNNLDVEDDENNSALILDDESEAYNTYTIKMNCLGYGNSSKDYTLDDFTVANGFFNEEGEEMNLQEYGDSTIADYFWQETQDIFLGGDIYGSVYIMENDGDDNNLSIDSTFTTAAWNPFKEAGIECQLNYIDFYVDSNLKTAATIEFFKDTDPNPYLTKSITFLPNIGYISSIIDASATNPVILNIANHGLTTGSDIYIYGSEGMTSINSGESSNSYTVTNIDDNHISLDDIDGSAFSEYKGKGKVYRKQYYKNKSWKRVFAGGIGFQHKIRFTSSGTDTPFKIHAMQPAFSPRGTRGVN